MHPPTPILFIFSLLSALLLALPHPLPALPGLDDAFGQRDKPVPMDTDAQAGNAAPAVAGTGTNILTGVVGAIIPRAVAEGVAESASKVVDQVVKRGMVNNVGSTAGNAVDHVTDEVVKRDRASGALGIVDTAENAAAAIVGTSARGGGDGGDQLGESTGGHGSLGTSAKKRRDVSDHLGARQFTGPLTGTGGAVGNVAGMASNVVSGVTGGGLVKRGMVNNVGHTAEHAVNGVVEDVVKRDAASGSRTKNVIDTVEGVVAPIA